MKKINVVFENDLDDVDMLIVPEYIAGSIEDVTQAFFNWVSEPKNRPLFEHIDSRGRTYISVGTQEFVFWLNEYAVNSGDSVVVYKEHTHFRPDYPTAFF